MRNVVNDLLKTVWINKENRHQVLLLKGRQLDTDKQQMVTVFYLADTTAHRIIGTAKVNEAELAVNIMFNNLEMAGIEFEIKKEDKMPEKKLIKTPLGQGITPTPVALRTGEKAPNVKLKD